MTEFSKTTTYSVECPTGDKGKVIKVRMREYRCLLTAF